MGAQTRHGDGPPVRADQDVSGRLEEVDLTASPSRRPGTFLPHRNTEMEMQRNLNRPFRAP
jgi:hypothetical protein